MYNKPLYNQYIYYIDEQLSLGKITKPTYSLMKISEHAFNLFEKKYFSDDFFKERCQGILKKKIRSEKIESFLKNND
jgi:hypothetical protein